jgi:PTH1 family peptidyl-tRNA hydrolase
VKYLIVGLGNKGVEYENTRHNIGFKVAEKIAESLEVSFSSANFGWMAEGKYKGRKVFVLKPDTYMNLSGKAVKFWMQKENIPLENVLIVTDDLALPVGTLRLEKHSGAIANTKLFQVEVWDFCRFFPRKASGLCFGRMVRRRK